MELQGRVAVITGGTRGIGRAIAEGFFADGASVVINGRSAEKGAQALKEMNGGDRVHFVQGDIKSREGCQAIIDAAIAKYGKIDIMVNNAGGATGHAPVIDLEDWAMEDSLKWNFWSTFWCTQMALRDMVPRGWGRIINVSSLEGKHGKPGVSIYVTAKHAINGFTKSCAQEIGTTGVTINCICPGRTQTPFVDQRMREYPDPEVYMSQMVAPHALKRLAQPWEIAAAALYLASDASANVTGSALSVDGGYTAGK
jgi:NAD(P)-dependent dehydrogenase (short-subunit alcohol dehydrogenase family)